GQVLTQQGQPVGTMQIAQFENPQSLEQLGSNMFTTTEDTQEAQEPKEVVVRQGFMERSNASPIQEMVSMIEASRLHEMQSKTLKQHSTLLKQSLNLAG
ncbi:MAG: flagellar basal body rod C-terminal domain-containing protein, partial [bacterium]